MNLASRLVSGILAGLLATSLVAADDAALNGALKQINRSNKKLRSLVGEVEYSEIVGRKSINGSGKVWIDALGMFRVEVHGDTPRTVMLTPPNLYIHEPNNHVVRLYDVTRNPHMLGQYALAGFAPLGTEMKKRYKVILVEDAAPSERPAFHFLLTPKSKPAAAAISRIELWVDPLSGLPTQQKIFHASGETELTIRYLSLKRDDALPASTFMPRWPEGTATVRVE